VPNCSSTMTNYTLMNSHYLSYQQPCLEGGEGANDAFIIETVSVK
jgi:hypothetical protein